MNAMTAIMPFKEWLTTRELAELKLPMLALSQQKIIDYAKRKNWAANHACVRKISGQAGGGGYEYHIDLLPAAARLAYISRFITVEGPPEAPPPACGDTMAEALSKTATLARDARLILINEADKLALSAKLSRKAADRHFSELYNGGHLPVEPWIKAQIKRLSARTLARWREFAAQSGSGRLAVDKAKNRQGKSVLAQAHGGKVQAFVLGCLIKQPHLSAHRVRDLVISEFGATLELVLASGEMKAVDVPPVRTFQYAINTLKERFKVELTAVTNPDAFRSRYRLSGRNSYQHVRALNQLWMIDASPADALCLDGRWSVYVAVEVYTRCLMLYVTRTPRAESVNLLLRRALLTWGVPAAIKTDNGSDFLAQSVDQFFRAMQIEKLTSAPFSPEEKSFVERAIGTMQHDLMPLLPGFIGHNVADRKRIEERRAFAERLGTDDRDTFAVELTGADLQRRCDEWAEQLYAFEEHSGLKGRSPAEAFALAKGEIRRIDERALDMLLMPLPRGGVRIMQKDGIRVDGLRYLCPSIMPETQVLVRMDPADLGRVYLYSPDSETFLGEAICPNARGINPKEFVESAKALQKAHIDARMAEAKREAKRLAKGPALIDRVLRANAEKAGKLVAFPKPETSYTTPALEAARSAYAPAEPAPLTPSQEALQAKMQAEFEARRAKSAPANTNVVPLPKVESKRERYLRAAAIERRFVEGVEISEEEGRWLASYKQSSEYRTLTKMVQAFGQAALENAE